MIRESFNEARGARSESLGPFAAPELALNTPTPSYICPDIPTATGFGSPSFAKISVIVLMRQQQSVTIKS